MQKSNSSVGLVFSSILLSETNDLVQEKTLSEDGLVAGIAKMWVANLASQNIKSELAPSSGVLKSGETGKNCSAQMIFEVKSSKPR